MIKKNLKSRTPSKLLVIIFVDLMFLFGLVVTCLCMCQLILKEDALYLFKYQIKVLT